MDPWAALLNKAGDYGPWGLVIAALAMALVGTSMRNAKLQDMRADDAKITVKAFVESTNTTDQFTKAMNARTETMTDWARQMTAMVDAMKGLQTTQAAFLQAQIERDRDARQIERDRGAR